MRRGLRFGAGALAGISLGVVLTLAIQAWRLPPEAGPRTGSPLLLTRPAPPETFLAWVPRGLPDGFAARVARRPRSAGSPSSRKTTCGSRVPGAPRASSSTTPRARTGSHSTSPPWIPPSFAPFLPPADRATLAAVENGEGILGSTSASVRRLGPGALLELGTGARIRIAAVLPDELVGAAELLVSKDVGRRIGVTRDRYLLIRPVVARSMTSASLRRAIRPLLPSDLGVFRKVQVRAPGETPYFRAGDAVLPPVLLKALFGEFAARPASGQPGSLEVDPAWIRTHLVTTRVPLLGEVTCHRGILPQLRGAMRELRDAGAADAIRSFHGCFVPRFISRDPTALLSHHSWGIAFDVNLVGNYYGVTPHQPPALMSTLRRWGFIWGGSFVVPDGNHFEYRRSPQEGLSP